MAMIDNNRLAVTSDNTVNIYDLKTYQFVQQLNFEENSKIIKNLTFVDDINSLISTSETGIIKVWDIDQCTMTCKLDKFYGKPINKAFMFNKSTIVASTSEGNLIFWENFHVYVDWLWRNRQCYYT